MRSAVRMCLLAVIPALLLAGCGDDGAGPGGVTAVEPPSDVFGLIGEFRAVGRERTMALAWVTDDPAAISGFHVYRSIAGAEYERITVDPVEFVEGTAFRYLDHDADVLSPEDHSYYATAVGPGSRESDPSPEVFVVPGSINNDEHVLGLSPSGGITGVSTTPTFSWTAKAGATAYCILLQDWDAPGSPIIWMYRDSDTSLSCGATLGATYVPMEADQLELDTHYRWQVFAINSDNMVFAWQEAYFWTHR